MNRLRASEVLAELSGRDRVLDGLMARHGPARLGRPVPVDARFAVLVRSIVSQQLAGSAARAIHARVADALGGRVTPDGVLGARPDALAGCGLSRAKVAAVTDLADRVARGQVQLARIGRLDDAAVVDHLVQVRGIGVWTAEMFLLVALARPDVWPVGDLGVRTGYALAWRTPSLPSPARLGELGDRFRPFRSTVAWYCWRVADQAKQSAAGAAGQRRRKVDP
ncbi:MAG: DNA-3-methyladenine glycosylase family protein [Acidimicrobiales bacterium]